MIDPCPIEGCGGYAVVRLYRPTLPVESVMVCRACAQKAIIAGSGLEHPPTRATQAARLPGPEVVPPLPPLIALRPPKVRVVSDADDCRHPGCDHVGYPPRGLCPRHERVALDIERGRRVGEAAGPVTVNVSAPPAPTPEIPVSSEPTTSSCSACESKPYCKGLCRAHYLKLKRERGKRPAAPPDRPAAPKMQCSISSCEGRRKARGFCHRHYTWCDFRVKTHGILWSEAISLLLVHEGEVSTPAPVVDPEIPTRAELAAEEIAELRALRRGVEDLLGLDEDLFDSMTLLEQIGDLRGDGRSAVAAERTLDAIRYELGDDAHEGPPLEVQVRDLVEEGKQLRAELARKDIDLARRSPGVPEGMVLVSGSAARRLARELSPPPDASYDEVVEVAAQTVINLRHELALARQSVSLGRVLDIDSPILVADKSDPLSVLIEAVGDLVDRGLRIDLHVSGSGQAELREGTRA